MKTLTHLVLVLLLFYSPSIFAQENQRLDSLLASYRSQPNGIEKIRTAEEIFFETRGPNPEIALEYLHKGLKLSKQVGSQEDEAMALKNELHELIVRHRRLASYRVYP